MRGIPDIEARKGIRGHGIESILAYQARQRVKKPAFEDLRSACLRLGGRLTEPFLRLDKNIDDFAADWIAVPSAGDPIRKGTNAGLVTELRTIELQAVALREEASNGMKRCLAVLAETQEQDSSGGTGHTRRITGRVSDGVNDDLALCHLVKDDVGVGRRRHPADGWITRAATDVGIQQQEVGDRLYAGLNPPRALRRMGGDVI
jgi:hypothetical protein